jgi:integrase
VGIYSRKGPRGTRWWIRWWDHGRERRECAGTTAKQAKQLLTRRRGEALAARHPDLPANRVKMTIEKLLNDHLKHGQSIGLRSTDVRRGQAAHLLKDTIAALDISALGPREVERYVARRLASKPRPAPATINRELALLRGAFTRAVRDGFIDRHPMLGLSPLREPPGRLRILSPEEEADLLKKCHPRLRALVLVAIYSGLRRGEVLALRKRDVDLEAGIIHVERSAPGGEAGTKSGERRDVPLHPVLREVFEKLARGRRPEALLWQTRKGKPYRTASRAFHGAAGRAKLDDVRLHDLRHTAASRLAMAGASLEDIARVLGHRDLRTTRRYVHLLRDHLRARVEAVSPTGSKTGKVTAEDSSTCP